MDTNKKINILLFFILSAFAIGFLYFIGSVGFISPILGDINLIDEGQFGAWIAHMLHGKLLYKDIYAAYGPLYIYPLYLLSKIFGQSAYLIRVVYIVVNTYLSLIIVWLVLKKLQIKSFWKIFCLLLFLIFSISMRQAAGLLTILLVFQAIQKKNIIWSILAGTSLPISFLISSEVGIFSTVISIMTLFYYFLVSKSLQSLFKKVGLMIVGGTLISITFFAWSNHEGWFYAYIHSIFYDLFSYVGEDLPIGKNFPNILLQIQYTLSPFFWIKYFFSQDMLSYWQFLFSVILAVYLFIRVILKKFSNADVLVAGLALFGLFLSIILIGRPGHSGAAYPSTLILITFFLNQLFLHFKTSKDKTEKYFTLALMVFILLFPVRIISVYRPHFTEIFKIPKALSQKNKNPQFVGPIAISNVQKKSIRIIQSFVWKNTKPTDPIFFFNNEPAMYMFVQRDNPTPYDLTEVASIYEKRLEMYNELITIKPKYIIDDTTAWDPDEVSNRRRFPEIWQFMQANYSISRLENFIIYSRNSTE